MSTIRLEIYTIERKVFDDNVSIVVAPGSEGVLGILPKHTPLLTALSFGELQIKREGEPDEFFAIGGGFMEVRPDHVVVMADSAEYAQEIDVDRAKEAQERAKELLERAEKGEDIDFSKAETAMRRSALRLKVAERRRRHRGEHAGSRGPMG